MPEVDPSPGPESAHPAGGGASPVRWLERELDVMSSGRRDRWAHRRGEPRVFAALWAMYLFGSAVVALGASGMAGLVTADVYRPAARLMLGMLAFGIAVVWPMLRLSQEAPERPVRAFGADLLVVLLPTQVLLWTQALPWMAAWPVGVVGATTVELGAWALVVSGLLALYFTLGAPLPRWLAMAGVLVTALAGPALVMLRGSDVPAGPERFDPLMMGSVLTAVFETTRDRSWLGVPAAVAPGHWFAGAFTGLVGLLFWSIAWGMGVARRARPA